MSKTYGMNMHIRNIIMALVVIVLVAFRAIPAVAGIDAYADGYDWLTYSRQEKLSLTLLLYEILRVDRNRHQVIDGVFVLDYFCHNAILKKKRGYYDYFHTKRLLSTPCIRVLAEIIISMNRANDNM